MKRQLRIGTGMDVSVTIEIDLDVLTADTAKEIVSFWTGGDEVLDASNDDVFEAAARYAASSLMRFLIDNYTASGAIRQLCCEEGWPPEEQLGMRIVDSDLPDFDPSMLEVTEIHA